MSHTVIDGESITATDADGDSFTLGVATVSTYLYAGKDLYAGKEGNGVVTVRLASEDLRALAEFCARAIGAEPPLVWRECDPRDVKVGWLVESRSDSCTLRAVVTELAHGQILGGDASSRCLLWSPSVDWALWTTAPAPEYTPEERALRDLLSDLDPEKLAKVITAANAAFGGGSK